MTGLPGSGNGAFILKYNKIMRLKNNAECCLRNGNKNDGQVVLDNFNLTHAQTDYLLSYIREQFPCMIGQALSSMAEIPEALIHAPRAFRSLFI